MANKGTMVLEARDNLQDVSDPLRGKRILVTRARSQASSLSRGIEMLGGEVVEFPTIEIRPPQSYEPLDQAIQRISSYDWLMFTSVNGVEQFLNRFDQLGRTIADLAGIEVGAIGPETAKRLIAAQIQPTLVPEWYQAEGILEALTKATMREKKVLIPRAAKARDILPETLRQWGARVDVVAAYQTVLPQVDVSAVCRLFREGKIDVVTFTSSSTVSNFAAMLQNQDLSVLLAKVTIACIGPITKKTLEDLGMRAEVVAEEFTIPGLLSAMVSYFSPAGTERLDRDNSGGL
jgi:uroporphyrinogen III methyltransferase/synthase